MSHDHEALQLAVASLDFELSPEEQARMQAGLLECAECAEAAASHHELGRLLGRLPVRDASPYVRERVLRAALVPPRDRQWPVLLAAAALLALLIGAAAAAGAFRDPQPLDATVQQPSGSPPALGDVSSPVPSGPVDQGSPQPGQGPPGTSIFGAPMAPDTLAEVVSGRLRIRSEPRVADDSVKYEPLLDVGVRLLILEGPVVANDYEWYQVTAWDTDLYASWPRGWVARGDHDGSPWIRPRADPCPKGEITIDVVEGMHPQERVACFRDRSLRLRAFVSGSRETSPCSAADDASCVDGPAWLTSDGGWSMYGDAHQDTPSIGGPRLALDPNGDVAVDDIRAQSMVDVVGAFDHPAAQGCRPHGVGASVGSMTEAAARLECRARFVVTAVEVDHDYPVANGPSVTVSDRLRVRSEPGLDGDRYELLPIGTSVWVVDGPVVAADYEWFQVIVPSVEVDGVPRVGWVAESDHGGERWLARRNIDCPGPSLQSVADLARLVDALEPHRGLACFGSSSISFRGSVQLVCGTEGRPAWDLSPAWLSANAFYQVSISDGRAVVRARPGPDLGLPLACNALADAPVLVEAHFDDGVAGSCDASPRTGGAPPDLGVVAVYWCRTTLVIDRLSPRPAVVPTPLPTPVATG